MLYNNVELTVQIKGKPITEYPHNGQVFVEGRENSTFEIVVKNHNPMRVEAVVSVDGLSVLDGKDAGPASPGYLLNAGETIVIPGWKLTSAQVASFTFAGKGQSYAQAATGTSRNTGVIGLLVYKERAAPTHHYVNHNLLFRGGPSLMGGGSPMAAAMGAVPLNMAAPAASMNALRSAKGGGAADYATFGAGHPGIMNISATVGSGMSSAAMSPGVATSICDESFSAGTVETSTQAFVNTVEQQLGTGFGEAQNFQTTEVQFNRGDMVAMIVLYYDNARGLKSRGIDLSRRATNRATQTPNAFPGMSGCTPPPGWTG